MTFFRRTPKNAIKPGSYLERRDRLVREIEEWKKREHEGYVKALGYDPAIKDEIEHCIAITDALQQDLLILDTKHELGL